MASSFGVHLKKADAVEEPKKLTTTPGGARRSDFKTKPVSDLKAMFNKKDEKAKSSEIVTTKKPTTATTIIDQRANLTKNNSKSDLLNVSKFSSSTTASSKFSKDVSSSGLSKEDITAFALLKDKLATTNIADLDNDEPVVAVAKTYSGGNAYKATVDGLKIQRSGDDNKPATKSEAASLLSFGLTKLRTRPGSLKNDEEPSAPSTVRGFKSPRSQSPHSKDIKKDTKYIPGVAKGWKGSGDEQDSESKVGRFQDSSVGKMRTEIKTEKEVKVKGFRSVSPVNLMRQSSEDSSSGSINLSPRGYKPNVEFAAKSDKELVTKAEKDDDKTDVNKNIKKPDFTKTNQTVFKSKSDNQNQIRSDIGRTADIGGSGKLADVKTNTKTSLSPKHADAKDTKFNAKPKLSAVEQLAQDRERLKEKRNSGSFSSDSEKGKRSPKAKGDFKWMDKSRISLEEFKEQQKVKNELHRPLSRASSSGSNSSLSKSDSSDIRSRIERFASPEPKDSVQSRLDGSASPLGRTELQRRDFATSKKINPDRFKNIKQGFERGKIESGSTAYQDHKPHLRIKTEKRLLERKQSLEEMVVYRKKSNNQFESMSSRDKGNVLQTVKALTELDAKAKAETVIVRRTNSLPSESHDEDSSAYEDTEQYYEELERFRMGDDVSNEGDISSEADLIYEEIPAYISEESKKTDMQDKKATAFRKSRRKASEEQAKVLEPQPGTDGDIDSDTDSSNSGIYEYVDNEGHELPVSDSDSAPELPAPRQQSASKKKKKKDTKGEKGEKEKKGLKTKIKQFYKGNKGIDTEAAKSAGGNNSVPQSAGVLSKLKNLKKTKSSNSAPNLEVMNNEDIPVCASSGTDTDVEIDPNSQRSSKSEEGVKGDDNSLAPPPLPPRHGELNRNSSGSDISKYSNGKDKSNRLSANSDQLNNRQDGENYENAAKISPALPPRNRISNNLDLNVVIPVSPGGINKKGMWLPNKDGYMPMQNVPNSATSPDVPYMDDLPSPNTTPSPNRNIQTDVPPLPSRPPAAKRDSNMSTGSYVDVDKTPPVPPRPPPSKVPLSQKDSYVDVGDAPLPDSNYSLADEIRKGQNGRKELDKRPSSSGYIKPNDLTTIPAPQTMTAVPVIEDVYNFVNQNTEDGLYIDLVIIDCLPLMPSTLISSL